MGRFEEIVEELMHVIPVFVRKIHAGSLQHMSLSPAQLFVLMLINETGSSRVGVISRELSITAPTATGIVDRLERDGFVSRVHDKRDRRAVNIVLTKKGRSFLDNMRAGKYERVKQVFKILSPEDREHYLRILKILVERMSDV